MANRRPLIIDANNGVAEQTIADTLLAPGGLRSEGRTTLAAAEFVDPAARDTVAMGSTGDRVTPIDILGLRILTLTSAADITINSGGYADQAFPLYGGQRLQLVNGNTSSGTITLGVAFTPMGFTLQPGESVELFAEPGPPSSVWRAQVANSAVAGVASVVGDGSTAEVDNTDPVNPVVSAHGALSTAQTYADAGDAATLAAALAADLPDAPSDGKTYGRKDGAWAEAGGSSQPLVIALSSVTKSSKFGSSTKLALGSHYFDPTDAQWGLSATSTAKLCMLLETTNAGIAVGGELFQQTGTGSPQIIAAVPTTTSTTAALVTADVSSAFTSTSAAGVFVARCWITTANGSDQCTCSGAWVEVTP